jgi:hypothetical protein
MKLLYLLLLILPLPFVFANDTDPIDKTAELIKQGDIRRLSKDFSSNVELTIMGEGDVYPSTEAETKLSDFFAQHQPRSVKILHRIVSNPNFRFAVLILTTNNGVYRTSFSLRKVNESFELNELRIEAEKTK